MILFLHFKGAISMRQTWRKRNQGKLGSVIGGVFRAAKGWAR
jgi:hypothetical protein